MSCGPELKGRERERNLILSSGKKSRHSLLWSPLRDYSNMGLAPRPFPSFSFFFFLTPLPSFYFCLSCFECIWDIHSSTGLCPLLLLHSLRGGNIFSTSVRGVFLCDLRSKERMRDPKGRLERTPDMSHLQEKDSFDFSCGLSSPPNLYKNEWLKPDLTGPNSGFTGIRVPPFHSFFSYPILLSPK